MSELDDLFERARSEPSRLPASLSARILGDAEAVQAALRQPVPVRSAPPGILGRLLGAFGGSGPVAGGLLAGCAGLAIGYLQPEALAGLSAVLASEAASAEVELMPGFEALYTEE